MLSSWYFRPRLSTCVYFVCNVFRIMRYEDLVEYKITTSIVVNYIVDVIVCVAVTASRCSLPDYFVLTRLLTEYFI